MLPSTGWTIARPHPRTPGSEHTTAFTNGVADVRRHATHRGAEQQRGRRACLRRNPAAHAPSSDTCSAFVTSISVGTPTSLLRAGRGTPASSRPSLVACRHRRSDASLAQPRLASSLPKPLSRASERWTGNETGNELSETESNREQETPCEYASGRLRTTRSLGLGAGRSQVQILSPRLKEIPAN
jgi:hypothetical protein